MIFKVNKQGLLSPDTRLPENYTVLCTFQISVDFYYVRVGGRGGAGDRGVEFAGL
jgi:hypothetical protein